MSLFKRGNIWWFKFKFSGQEIRESAKTTSKTLAQDAERKRRRTIEESYNGLRKRQTPMLFAVAARKWMEINPEWRPKTRELHEFCLQHLTPVFGDVLLTDITPDDTTKLHGYARRQLHAASTLKWVLCAQC